MNPWCGQFFSSILFASLVAVSSVSVIGDRWDTEQLSDNEIRAYLANQQEDAKPTVDSFPYVVYTRPKKPCTLASMAISVAVPYLTKGGKKETKTLDVPRDAVAVSGTCSPVVSEMKLTWKAAGKEENRENAVKFTFINDHNDFSLFSIGVDVFLDAENFPDAKTQWFNATSEIDLRLFLAPVATGIHRCGRETKRNVGDAVLTMKDVSLIAFNANSDISTRKDQTCPEKEEKSTTFPYVVRNKDSSSCILARMSISLTATYATSKSEIKSAVIKVPSDARVDGNCDSVLSSMQLTWSEVEGEGKENSVKFRFVKDEARWFAYMINVDIFPDEKNFPDAVDRRVKMTSELDNLFSAPADNGLYSCANETALKFDDVSVTVSDVLLVAFDARKDFASKKVADCRVALSQRNFQYVVEDPNTSVPCTLANMSITLDVTYKKADGDGNVILSVPKNATASGTCEGKRSEMKLSWPGAKAKDSMNTLSFYIGRNATDFFVNQISVDIYLDETTFPGATDAAKRLSGTSDTGINLFAAPSNDGLYNCTNRTEQVEAEHIKLSITDVIFVAFNTEEDLTAKKVSGCPGESNDSTTTTTTTEPTTSSSSTTESTTPSTTESTSSATVSSTAPPEPDPSVAKYNYVLTNPETHVACIVANMSISINIPYKTKDSKPKNSILKVPTKLDVNGKCDSDATSTMTLTWPVDDSGKEVNAVTFTFKKDESRYHLGAISLDIYMDEKRFPDAAGKKYEAISDELNMFPATLRNLYKCEPETSVTAKDAGITIAGVALIAFNDEKSIASRSEENCIAEETGSDVGAIVGGIIGCIIVVAVVVFLYIMYRRRRFG